MGNTKHNKDNEKVTGVKLTLREKEVLIMICSGARNKEIAENLGISPNTVKNHVYRIYKKLKVNNRFQTILWSSKHL